MPFANKIAISSQKPFGPQPYRVFTLYTYDVYSTPASGPDGEQHRQILALSLMWS